MLFRLHNIYGNYVLWTNRDICSNEEEYTQREWEGIFEIETNWLRSIPGDLGCKTSEAKSLLLIESSQLRRLLS